MRSRDHKPPRYLAFTAPLLPRPFWAKISPQQLIVEHPQS